MYLDTSSSGLFAEPSGYINFLEINMTIIYSKKKKVIWKTGNPNVPYGYLNCAWLSRRRVRCGKIKKRLRMASL